MAVRLKHMVVVLPGITGSVLTKDGRPLWAPSLRAAGVALFQQARYVRDLRLHAPEDGTEDLEDGITATALMPDAVMIPGLVKLFDGYSALSRAIRGRFEVEGQGVASPAPTNLLEIPYDWRRDNRVSAKRVGRIIDQRLTTWRDATGPDAKCIIIAHSMGGLVARYYLEVLGGWDRCLALVTLGTPFAGSLNALNFLQHGYKVGPVDLGECLRSFDSVYQLLPTYPVIRSAGGCHTVVDTSGLPHVEYGRARAAAAFHREIGNAVREHQTDPRYLREGYKVLPFVGTRQPTLQSANFNGAVLEVVADLPPDVDELLDGGDGTVPRFSATPPELDQEFRETFLPEKHGSLQASTILLNDLIARLDQMQVPRRAIRGPELQREGSAISLALADVFATTEPVEFRARALNADDAGGLFARVWSVGSPAQQADIVPMHEENGDWVARLGTLRQSMYRVEVQAHRPYPEGPPAVHDLFDVW